MVEVSDHWYQSSHRFLQRPRRSPPLRSASQERGLSSPRVPLKSTRPPSSRATAFHPKNVEKSTSKSSARCLHDFLGQQAPPFGLSSRSRDGASPAWPLLHSTLSGRHSTTTTTGNCCESQTLNTNPPSPCKLRQVRDCRVRSH